MLKCLKQISIRGWKSYYWSVHIQYVWLFFFFYLNMIRCVKKSQIKSQNNSFLPRSPILLWLNYRTDLEAGWCRELIMRFGQTQTKVYSQMNVFLHDPQSPPAKVICVVFILWHVNVPSVISTCSISVLL